MGGRAIVETRIVKFFVLAFAVGGLTVALTAPLRAEQTTLHPPQALLQSLGQLREIDSLAGLPAPIRRGVFVLPDATTSVGWVLAAPGAAWNATDAIVDPSLPGRRMIFAACNATICVLHYERGGIAHIYLVMALARKGDGWAATWLAYGHPAAPNMEALEALLRNRSPLDYHDDTDAHIDY
jgi:hypothetical protein